jgi:hypothetical protein
MKTIISTDKHYYTVMPTIAIGIDSTLVGELFLRAGPKADVASMIEEVVKGFLEETADRDGWSDSYYQYRKSVADAGGFADEFGDPQQGYHWAPVFLNNGTLLRMGYKREAFHASVKFGKIEYNGKNYSPSEFARAIARNTSRNAWRDIMLKRPGDSQWILADELRRRSMK